MAWRGVHISRAARLSLRDGQMSVAQDDGEVTLPLEDVAYVMIDTPQVVMSTALMAAAMESGVALIATDARHMPCGVMLPFHRHHRQAAMAALQMNLTAPFRKRCWQRLVVAKIKNQAAHLTRTGREQGRALSAMASRVGSGDPRNVEARAAHDYWGSLFADFIRDNPKDLRNQMLNFGYAVTRSAIARAMVGAGLLPAIGLHHASATNAFNLADDLIEPFRPFIDSEVRRRAEGRLTTEAVTIDDRRILAGMLMGNAHIGGETSSLLIAIEKAVESLVCAMETGSPTALLTPSFVEEEATA